MEETIAQIAKRKYTIKRANAKKNGHEFTLTYEDMIELVKIRKCFYTGVELKMSTDVNQFPNTWTLDRIDSNTGYTKENTIVCSFAANQYKSLTFDIVSKTMLKAMQKDIFMFNCIMSKISLQPESITIKKSKWERIWEILKS